MRPYGSSVNPPSTTNLNKFKNVHWDQFLIQGKSPMVFSQKKKAGRRLKDMATMIYKVKNDLVPHFISELFILE